MYLFRMARGYHQAMHPQPGSQFVSALIMIYINYIQDSMKSSMINVM